MKVSQCKFDISQIALILGLKEMYRYKVNHLISIILLVIDRGKRDNKPHNFEQKR